MSYHCRRVARRIVFRRGFVTQSSAHVYRRRNVGQFYSGGYQNKVLLQFVQVSISGIRKKHEILQ